MKWNPLDYRIGRPIFGLVAGAVMGASVGLITYDIPREIYRAATNAPYEEIQVPPDQRMMYVSSSFTEEKTHLSKSGFVWASIPGGLAGLIAVPFIFSSNGRRKKKE